MKIDIPDTGQPRVVIVGGGFGGIELAKALKHVDVQVVMLDYNNFHTFQPLLYQVATSALEETSIATPFRKIFKDQDNFYFRMAEVKDVIPDENIVITSISRLRYDHLVIATGSQSNYFGNEGLIISSMPMKTVNEALNLRSLILQNFEKALVISNERKKQGYMNYVIAGGGPTGVELAGALGELKQHIFPRDYPELDISRMNIYLIQSPDRLLPALSEKSSRKAKEFLEELGVEVWVNTRVVDFHGDYVQTNRDEDFIARTLIWTAGVVGYPIGGLSDQCIVKGNRILVDEYNQVKGHDNIYAIGDVAAMLSDEHPNGHPMMAPVAIQQGRWLKENLERKLAGRPMRPFKYFDKGAMATVGKHKAVVDLSSKVSFQGVFAWFIWIWVHLLYLIGFRNKVITLFNWLQNYFNSERGVRLILTPFALRKAKRKRKQQFLRMEKEKSEEQKASGAS